MDHRAAEAQDGVAQHRPRQHPGFEQNLKPVADPQHRTAHLRERAHRGHHRGAGRHSACAQVVAVGESSRQDDRVQPIEGLLLMPDLLDLLAEHRAQHMDAITIAVAGGKDDDAESHHDPWERGSTGTRERPVPSRS